MLLGKLALHYWRPDFTPQQSRQLYADYAEDLLRYPFEAIDAAIKAYRRSGERFYPTIGQIVGLIEAVPAWDVIGKREHLHDLHHAAAVEIETMTKNLALTGPSETKRIGAGP